MSSFPFLFYIAEASRACTDVASKSLNFITSHTVVIIIISCFLPLHRGSTVGLESDTISFNTSSLRDPQTIVSRNQLFKLGFYSPDQNTTNRYMAIFISYSETKAVWIANRDRPLDDSSGVITVSKEGNLILMNGDDEVVWSTNITTTAGYNLTTTAQILDSGNLVLYYYSNSSNGKVIIWDSFSHPSDVWFPTMALTDDTNTGNKVMLSSWTDRSDPSVGSFRLGLQALDIPQFFIWHSDGRPHHRSGPWNGQLFTGEPTEYQSLSGGGYRFSETSPGIFSLAKPPTELRCLFFLDAFGTLVPVIWDDQNRSWTPTLWTPANECDIYGKCGPFGVCDTRNSPASCSCLRGFEPVDKEEWDRRNWTSGCVRKARLLHGSSNNDNNNNSNIGKGKEDGFLRLRYLKLPDFAEKFNSVDEEECRLRCLRNCCCIAYSYYTYNIGCMLWRERDEGLIDIQQFPAGVGLDLHLRLAASELDDGRDKIVIIVIPVIVVSVLILIFIVWCWMVKRRGDKTEEQNSLSHSTGIFLQDVSERSVRIKEMPLFAYNTLAIATNHFHGDNLLGKGGFGHVYRGQLKNRKEIAVKRLSKASSQGVEEFTNELHVISKLQHKNLVRLVGCCVEKEEKMLVYEYMPNKSLNLVLFDLPRPISSEILDWEKRLNIIKGIGRGLLYLHRDSRLRIIHRDLKASNVLLDQEWNPKISDFGIARIFDTNQDQDNTVRVAGTFGYMSPEYATEGRFSEKSDVYSFGVLMLEIISGKKNTHYYNHDSSSSSLLGCAWKFFMGDNGVPFMDENILNIHSKDEMVRCTHIALLCVQEFANDRPTIQTVLSMLEGEIIKLPIPEQPLLANRWSSTDDQSTNQIEHTVTVLDGDENRISAFEFMI